ncbi:universal stress protein [Amycolatopsis alkalitolerans]|nr:universal stress protein [Amycolatopsis alkalitolerans]
MTSKGFLVAGVDGSASSTAALRWAMEQAEITGAELLAVTAWSHRLALDPGAPHLTAEEEAETHRKALRELVEAVRRPGVEVRMEVVEGDPADMLLRAAKGARLLVLGSHGHGLVLRALVGSVSARCLRLATCPVLVLPVPAVEAEAKAGEAVASLGYDAGPVL